MAVPRTSVQPPRTEVRQRSGGGLSLQTLIIAALASGIAAVLVSHFWARGTVLFSAMTPVAVAIISELLKKPVESERVRGSVRAVSSFSRPSSGRTPRVMAPPTPGVDEGIEQRQSGVEAGPVRIYSSGSNKRPASTAPTSERRKLHLKIAVITGLVAFLIAAAVLTLPELIFGGSVGGGGRSTTYFGGGSGSSSKSDSKDSGTSDGSSGSQDQQNQPDSTSPSNGQDQSQPSGGDSTSPDTQQSAPPSSQNTSPSTTPAPAPPQTPSAPTP